MGQGFPQWLAAVIDQGGQYRLGSGHEPQCRLHLLSRQDDRDAFTLWRATDRLHPGKLHAQNLPVQKQQSIEGLPVGSRCDALFMGEHGQEGFDLSLARVAGMLKNAPMAAGCP